MNIERDMESCYLQKHKKIVKFYKKKRNFKNENKLMNLKESNLFKTKKNGLLAWLFIGQYFFFNLLIIFRNYYYAK